MSSLLKIIIISIFINTIALSSAVYTIQIYDRVLTSHSIPTLVTIFILFIGALILQNCLTGIRNRALIRVANRYEANLTHDAAIASLLFAAKGTAEQKPQAIADIEKVRSFISDGGLVALIEAPWIIFYSVILWFLHPVLGLAATIGVFSTAALTLFTRHHQTTSSAADEESGSHRSLDISRENATHARAIGYDEELCAAWADRRRRRREALRRVGDRSEALRASARFLKAALQAGMIAVAAVLTLKGLATAGIMMASSILLSRISSPVEAIVNKWSTIGKARAAHRRLQDVISENRRGRRSLVNTVSGTGILSFDKLSLFDPLRSTYICEGLTFSLNIGDVLVISGPHSSGKTTTLKSIAGLIPPSGGTIKFNGVDVINLSKNGRRKAFSYMPEVAVIVDGSINDNLVLYGQERNSSEILSFCEIFGIKTAIERLPSGYNTDINVSRTYLSHSVMKKICLISCLTSNKELIMIDGLDLHLESKDLEKIAEKLSSDYFTKSIVVVCSNSTKIRDMATHIIDLDAGNQPCFEDRSSENRNTPSNLLTLRNIQWGTKHRGELL